MPLFWQFLLMSIIAVCGGVWLGWIVFQARERSLDREAMQRIGADQRVVIDFANSPRAETPVQRETQKAALQTKAGQSIGSPRTWDKRLETFGGPTTIPYEELEGMFLDQFLLRYFYSLMPETITFAGTPISRLSASRPWDSFLLECPWAKEMPLLFEQMTGYALNEIQLNNAIAEWARRLSKTPRAETPVQRETQTTE
jgi:hypothetical protein